MNDTDKKILTEWMGECWHEPLIISNPIGIPEIYCKKCGYIGGSSLNVNRTFTTWQDLGDVKDKLVEKGLWPLFRYYVHSTCAPDILVFPDTYTFLFRPVNEKGEPHFCGLVAEFKPWEKEAGI